MAKKHTHTTTHIVDGREHQIGHNLDDAHVAAFYHEQEFGPHPTADSTVLGDHDSPINGTVTVEYVAGGDPVYGTRPDDGQTILVSGSPTGGPVFKISLLNGEEFYVLDETTAGYYLGLFGVDGYDPPPSEGYVDPHPDPPPSPLELKLVEISDAYQAAQITALTPKGKAYLEKLQQLYASAQSSSDPASIIVPAAPKV